MIKIVFLALSSLVIASSIATTLWFSTKATRPILFGPDAFDSRVVDFDDLITHEVIHVAGQGPYYTASSLWGTLWGSHDLSAYKHYDKILKACK